MQTFDFRLNVVSDSSLSILAVISGFIAPVFSPLGFGSWQVTTSLMTGFLAKESVVSTLEVLFTGGITSVMSPLCAASLLTFCLLYTPCIAAITSVKRELGVKWAVGMVAWQCAIAWILALAVRLVGMIFGAV